MLRFLILFAFLLITTAYAGVNYKQLKIQELEKLAEAKDPIAQYELGCAYYGLARNNKSLEAEKAFNWWRESARAGNADAQLSMWYSYIHRDERIAPISAFHFLTKSAEQGNIDAQYNLAYAYDVGLCLSGKPEKQNAIIWYNKAAERGHADSQAALGKFAYHENKMKEAYMWLSLARSHKEKFKEDKATQVYVQRYFLSEDNEKESSNLLDILKDTMTTEEISQAEGLVSAWNLNAQNNQATGLPTPAN